MSTCIMCKKEIAAVECMVDGRPAVCAWIPQNAGKSVYAIVSAHVRCMGVEQLRQAHASLVKENEKRGYPPEIFYVVEKRLSELLANPRADDLMVEDGPGRFALLEID